MVVVVTNESNIASCFSEAGNLNGNNADTDGSNETIILLFPALQALLAAILVLSVTATPILPSGRVTSTRIRCIA